MPRRRFVLLDRDGTLIVHHPYLSDPDAVELLPGTVEGLAAMRKLGLGSVAELVSFADRLKLDDPCPGMHALAGRFRNGTAASPVEA